MHFSLIFGNIAILTNSSKRISKIIVAKLNSFVKVVFGAFHYDRFAQKRSFLSFNNFTFTITRDALNL